MNSDFSAEEWETCLKVLKVIARNPDAIPDNDAIKGLLTKLYKRAKKENKSQVAVQRVHKILTNTSTFTQQRIQKLIQEQQGRFRVQRAFLSQSQLYQNYEHSVQDSMLSMESAEQWELPETQRCYICKTSYASLHFFYHLLCPDCAAYNYTKRGQSSNLQGRIVLITGGRIKIGYYTALKLLRDGATVYVSTRFPKDCASRFAKEKDFEQWHERLNILTLDLRNIPLVQQCIRYLTATLPHLDIIINNAAQTIKRPPEFYRHLLEFEAATDEQLEPTVRNTLVKHTPFAFVNTESELKPVSLETELLFPKGQLDKDGQQLDLREKNSWSSRLEEITPIEMLETQLVSVTAPFMLNSLLKPLMLKSPFERRFIINVSAMEGQFNRTSKTAYHPHTNMAKAALNMMTRTSAQDYARDGIYMNSVDTGWITQENPYPKKEQIFQESGFVPPLDEIDGMARIYDPIACGINNPEIPLFGHFLKDYKPYDW